MRKLVILSTLGVLIAVAAIVAWFLTANHRIILAVRTADATHDSADVVTRSSTGFPPPAILRATQKTRSAVRFPQISAVDTHTLEQEYSSWQTAHGCDWRESATGLEDPLAQVRLKAQANDLTEESELGIRLIMDPKSDGHIDGLRWLRQAMVQGSVCAIRDDAMYGFLARHGQRIASNDPHIKFADYRVAMPTTDAAKRLLIMNGYAWDFLYEMRSGVPVGPDSDAPRREHRYNNYRFKPTAAEWAYACQRANDMYQDLQSQREAEGLGLFDDSPPSMRPMFSFFIAAFREATQKPGEVKYFASHPAAGSAWGEHTLSAISHNEQLNEVGGHCSEWPTAKVRWQPAIAHNAQRNGETEPDMIWIPASDVATPKAGNQ